MSSFDQFDSDGHDGKKSEKPIWTLDLNNKGNEDKVLDWLNAEFNYLKEENKERLSEIKKNIAIFKGIQYNSQEARSSNRDREETRPNQTSKIVINHLYDLTMQKVSRLVKYKPDVSIIPANDEFKDKVASKETKALWDYLSYKEAFDSKAGEGVLQKYITGEHYLWITWDFDKGPLHPDYKKAMEREEKVPLLDDNGNQKKDHNGKPLFIEQEVMIGDVCLDVVLATDVFLQKKRKLDDVEYAFRVKCKSTEELRQDYPDKASKIKSEKNGYWYNVDKLEEEKLTNETLVVEFWHKHTKYLNRGRKIVFTKDTILENDICPYSHGQLPFKRLCDIEIPGELYGRSFYTNGKHIAGQINNLTTMAVRNQTMVAHPKWFVPTSANVNVASLGNDITIVRYHGNQPPVLAQANPTPSEVFNFRRELKEDLQQVTGIFGVSRGEPPPGIKSGVALQFLNEQENERQNQEVAKYNEYVSGVAKMVLSVCADYYDESDQRTLMVLGRNSEWASMKLDPKSLVRPFDIRVQNSTALPQSKAARVQYLMDLKKEFPGMISDEQFLDMLDFGQAEKFVDQATAAVRAAEAENDDMINGKEVEAPEGYEMLVQHWKVHIKEIQTRGYKVNTPPEIKQKFADHILATEYLMVEAGKKNPQYMQMLSTLPQFPMFFESETQVIAQQLLSPGPVGGLPPQGQEGMPEAIQNEALSQPVVPNLAPVGEGLQPAPGPIEPASGLE